MLRLCFFAEGGGSQGSPARSLDTSIGHSCGAAASPRSPASGPSHGRAARSQRPMREGPFYHTPWPLPRSCSIPGLCSCVHMPGLFLLPGSVLSTFVWLLFVSIHLLSCVPPPPNVSSLGADGRLLRSLPQPWHLDWHLALEKHWKEGRNF